MENHYAELGVAPSATAAQIKAAHRALLKVHHPDAGGDPERARRINQAWDVLGNPSRRLDYDRERAAAAWAQSSQTYTPRSEPAPAPPPTYYPRTQAPKSSPFPWRRMLVGMAVVTLFVAWLSTQSPATPPPLDQLKTAAKRSGEVLFTYDYKSAGLLTNAVAAIATKEFAAEYRNAFDTSIRDDMIANQSSSTVTTVAVSRHRVDGISGTAYIEVFAHLIDRQLGDAYQTHKVALGFKRVGDRWRLDNVTPLG